MLKTTADNDYQKLDMLWKIVLWKLKSLMEYTEYLAEQPEIEEVRIHISHRQPVELLV